MIAVCTITCDRKLNSVYCFPRLLELEGDYTNYINHEGTHVNELPAGLFTTSKAIFIDEWLWYPRQGDWQPRIKFDQDQARLGPIAIARNMCIEYAMVTNASHLLFVDADVVPPVDTIPKLLALDHPIVGGVVPGRGCHSHVQYVFGIHDHRLENGIDIWECDHGTCGLMLIQRQVFEKIRFRWEAGLSEDPAFCQDALGKGFGYMWIRSDVIAEHKGDLKPEETAGF